MWTIRKEKGWTLKGTSKNTTEEVCDILDSSDIKIGEYHKGHRSYNPAKEKKCVTVSHYHLDTDKPAGKGNVHYITID